MDTNEYDRFATSRVFILAGIILVFGAVISALLWTTLMNFNRIHEASFEAVVTIEEARAEILRMQATLGRIMTEEDPAIRAALREDIAEAEKKLYIRFAALQQTNPDSVQINEVITQYNRWKLCRDAALVSTYGPGTFTECMQMVAAINERIDVLTEQQYRTSDQAYHSMLNKVRAGVVSRLVLMVILGIILMGIALQLRTASRHYVSRISETRLLYDKAVETMPDPLILVENDTGRILRVNPAAVNIYGYSAEELYTMRNTDLSGEPEKTAAVTLSDITDVPFRWSTRKDGSQFPVEIKISRFVWQGKAVHLAWIHDISDRISREQGLMDAVNAAKAGERAKTSFLANISHEIRTPMNGLLGALQLLEQSVSDEDSLQLLHIGIDSAHSLVRLLENTLDYSQMEAGQLELRSDPFSVVQEVRAVAALFDPASKLQGLSLETVINETLYPCYFGDAFRIRQIMINLISNALKFTEKGKVRVIADPLADAAGKPAGIVLCVSDTGCGIRPEDQTKIFQRFSQADHGPSMLNQGVGLGLAIVEELVRLMGGEIYVESVWHEGSRFVVNLPLKPCDDNRLAVPTAALNDEGDVYNKARILVIEDDDISRYLVMRILEKRGYAVDGVQDSAEALAKLGSRTYRLILMDLQLPDKTGFELTADIRSMPGSANAEAPIIAMTAYDGFGIREKCHEAGMQDYLSKPVLLEPLFATVERWIAPDLPE